MLTLGPTFKRLFIVFVILCVTSKVFSQAGTAVTMTVQNAIQTAPNEFTYEVWFTNTGTTSIALRGYSWGINHTPGLNNSGTITHSYVSRDAALATIPNVTPGYTATSNHIRGTTVNAAAGLEVALTAGVPIRIATMKIATSAPAFPSDFHPFQPTAPFLPLQTTTASGRTQCIATCIVTPPGTSYAINGVGNGPSPISLQALIGVFNTPCFYLNVTTPPNLIATTSSTTPNVCFGANNGSAEITLSQLGATAPAGTSGSYSVDGGSSINYTANPFSISSLSTGTHTVIATTSYGCVDTVDAIISGPTTPITSSFSATACSSYTLPWSTVVNSTGVYTNTYLDVNNCDSTVTANITIESPSTNSPVNATSCNSYLWSANNVTYTATGSYTASFTNAGGCDSSMTLDLVIDTTTYSATSVSVTASYTWTANNVTYTSSGVYTATLTNATNCDSILTLNLTVSGANYTLSLVEDIPISCNGANDGAIQATPSAPGTYTFSIDGGSFINNGGYFSGVAPGTHTICANDGSATVCDTITIIQPDPLSFIFSIDSTVSCNGNDGQISVVISGGTTILQPYLTLWKNAAGDTLNDQGTNNYDTFIDSLSPGTYFLRAEDDNGCVLNDSIVIGLAPPLVINASYPPITCNGGTTTITISSSGGTGNTYTNTVNGAPVAGSYSAGTYTITATDVKGCSSTTILTITEPTQTNNSFTVTATNTYTWPVNGMTYTTSGVYTATSTGSNGCVENNTLNLTINTAPFTVDAIADQHISCYGNNDGRIVSSTTGSGPFTFTLNGGSCPGCINGTGIFPNLAPGVYTVCAIVGVTIYCDTVTILSPDSISATFNIISMESCLGSDGILEISISGGTNMLQGYLTWWYAGIGAPGWPGGNTLNDLLTDNFALMLDSLPVGPYTVVVEDDNGCFKTFYGAMQSAPSVSLTASASTIVCYGDSATISLSATGGYPGAPFTYTINGSPVASQYGPGTYTIVATDSTNCADTVVLTITAPTAPITSTDTVTACTSYLWSLNSTTYTNSGLYTATVAAANSCDSIVILDLTINSVVIGDTLSATACVFYDWAANLKTYTATGIYSHTLTGSNNCDSITSLNVTINPAPNVSATGPTTICSNSVVTLTGSGASTYAWDPVVTNGSPFVISSSATYTVTGTDALNCTATSTVNINVVPDNGDVANTSSGNATSVAGSACESKNQIDGSTISYHDTACKLIATIQDPAGGNVIGGANVCVIVAGTTPIYNSQPYISRYYTISGSSGPASLTLYLTQDDFNDYNANAGTYPQIPVPASPTNGATATLCVSQVPQTILPGAPGSQTTVHQVTAVWNAAASRWEINFPINSFGGFYLHACTGVPLPANVISFTGKKEQTIDILEWTTSSEFNNDYFNLEYSKDGVQFEVLARVQSKATNGQSNSNLYYDAVNYYPAAGHNYYRLQQVDIQGQHTYVSNVVDLVRISNGNAVTIYPNPAQHQINVDLNADKISDISVKILDISGRVVKQVYAKLAKGSNSIKIGIDELANGVYTVQVHKGFELLHIEKLGKGN